MSKSPYDYVLDCSVTLSWCFEDERTDLTDAILESLKTSKAIVPTIWPLEVSNVLLVAQKSKRITHLQVQSFLDALSILPIIVDPSTTDRAMHTIYSLANQTGLSIYDAAYLELAIREGIPLISLDKALIKAAKKANLSTRI